MMVMLNAYDQQFFEKGVELCSLGLGTVTNFRRIMSELSKEVVQERLGGLSEALGVALRPANIRPHHYPSRVEDDWNGQAIWAAARIELPSFGTAYFGMFWGGQSHRDPRDARVAAMFATRNRIDCDRLIRVCHQHGLLDVQNWSPNEVGLFEVLPGTHSQEDFKACLARLIDRWLTFFTDIGGIPGFILVP
jgi:hypothetical protein